MSQTQRAATGKGVIFVLLVLLLILLQTNCRRIIPGTIKPKDASISDAQTQDSVPEPAPFEGPKRSLQPTVLLISLDGFRWDYTDRIDTPHLDRLRKGGVQAAGLIPVFPSKTFPNHYSIVTGLYTEHHGIVSNGMYDPIFRASFSMTDPSATTDGRWWEGEPIWVTAAKQGQRSGTMFWPGSEAEIKGERPTYWRRFDGRLSHQERLQQIFAWLQLPDDKRPTFLTLYFSDVDTAGHAHGPLSWEVEQAVKRIDETIGTLIAGLTSRGLFSQMNLLVTSDHGMANLDADKRIYLSDYIDVSTVFINDFSSILGLNARSGDIDVIYKQLKGKHPHLKIYKRDEVPARFHYNKHRRIPELIGVITPGWVIERDRGFPMKYLGTHGYDPKSKDMHGLFIAHGPAFKRGLKVDAFENVHLYELMCHILKLTPAKNDGSLNITKPMLR